MGSGNSVRSGLETHVVSSWQIFRDITLAELLHACLHCPADEARQAALLGDGSFDAEVIAANLHLRTGPRWAGYCDGKLISAGGFHELRPGVWQDWMINTSEAFDPQHWRTVTKYARRIMDAMLKTDAHRLQCVSLASRIDAHRWYRVLGYTYEGTLRGYCANGEDALMFSRVRARDGSGQFGETSAARSDAS